MNIKYFYPNSGKVILLSLFLPFVLIGQEDNIKSEIDRQIWIPFAESYQVFDYETFNSIHSDEMIRINSKEIKDAKSYKAKNEEWFKRAKKEGYQRSISFQFEKRIVTGDRAYETGYYEIKMLKPDGVKANYYARFHVLLHRDNGAWKIMEDWDSNTINGEKTSSKDYNKLKESTAEKPKEEKSILVFDYVKIIDKHKEEAYFYYENNWKMFRVKAHEMAYIKSYKLLVKEEDIVLITEYKNKEQYDLREEHFSAIMKTYQPDGMVLLNELKPSEFRKNVSNETLESL